MRTRTKKRIAAAVGAVAFLSILCVADGMDRFVIPAERGAVLQGLSAAVMTAAWWKAGWIKWRS